MSTSTRPSGAFVLAAALFAAACRGSKEEGEGKAVRVTIAEMSNPARSSAERATAGGTIEKIDRENERGRIVYDVEATVGGKHVEYTIADADGAIVGTETSVDFAELPAQVRAAAEKYFGTSSGLAATKGVEDGKTTYEVEGKKGGERREVTFDATGRIEEEGEEGEEGD